MCSNAVVRNIKMIKKNLAQTKKKKRDADGVDDDKKSTFSGVNARSMSFANILFNVRLIFSFALTQALQKIKKTHKLSLHRQHHTTPPTIMTTAARRKKTEKYTIRRAVSIFTHMCTRMLL